MTIIFSCKKGNDLGDQTTYLWKRELLTDVALNPLNNSIDSKEYLVVADYVYLTNAEVKEQEKNKRKEGTIFYYRFTKVDKEAN